MKTNNFQIATKVNNSFALPIMESFLTIQGEGFHQGKAAWFIRLAGCDVGCHWCDTKDSWDVSQYPKIPVEELIHNARGYDAEIAVITGGEPLMHHLDILTEDLKKAGFKTHIETSGAHSLSGKWDWISFSPKKFKAPKPEISLYANELKIVVFNESDLRWAEQWEPEVSKDCKLYLQPEWNKRKRIIPEILTYIQKNPRWEISLQMHKYLNIP